MSDLDIAANLSAVKAAMKSALEEAKRSPEEVKLVAVSKTFSDEEILPAIIEGQKIFGENRIQEARSKWPEIKKSHPDIELHLIGPLQTNKVKDAVELFDVIETVDREKLAQKLSLELQKIKKSIKVFVQVNTGDEPQKAGVAPDEVVTFVQKCIEEYKLPVVGLMCIPPAKEYAAPHFALLHKLAQEADLKEISMGMSADYEMACQLGATQVRVGSEIFGARA